VKRTVKIAIQTLPGVSGFFTSRLIIIEQGWQGSLIYIELKYLGSDGQVYEICKKPLYSVDGLTNS